LLAGCLLALAAAVALAAGAPPMAAAWQWNWANVALIQARGATGAEAMYGWSGAAIAGYAARPEEAAAGERLLAAYQLRWRGGSQIGEVQDALAAYAAGRDLAGDAPPDGGAAACAPGAITVQETATLEAEAFAGVSPGTLRIPASVAGRDGVLLFTTLPISQTVCLDAGVYALGVTAARSGPGPVELRVEWDGWPAGVLTYDGGESAWEQEQLRIVTPAGGHALRLTFANDFADPAAGIDRNALVDAVTITREERAGERQE
jgi:hypothetical protein